MAEKDYMDFLAEKCARIRMTPNIDYIDQMAIISSETSHEFFKKIKILNDMSPEIARSVLESSVYSVIVSISGSHDDALSILNDMHESIKRCIEKMDRDYVKWQGSI